MNKDFIIQLLLNVVDTQLKEQKNCVVNTYQRLIKLGYSESDTKKLIASCLSMVMNSTIEKESSFNDKRYAELLDKLPEMVLDA